MQSFETDKLRLTDFVDRDTLQEIQDGFAAVAQVKATITDADGNVLTQPAPTKQFLRRQRALAEAAGVTEDGVAPPAAGPGGATSGGAAPGGQPQREGAEYVAPIVVADQRVGTIRMSAATPPGTTAGVDDAKLQQLADRFGLDLKQLKLLAAQLNRDRGSRAAAVQFLFLLANAIARLCFQEYQLRQRIHEITAVYSITMMLAEARNLQKVLTRAARFVTEVMETKASSIRLVDEEKDELVIKAVHNLSPQYLAKGVVRLSRAEIDQVALTGDGFAYVANMQTDPRVQYPHEAAREGIVSMLSVGMRYKGRQIGVLRVYTDHEQRFSPLKIDLLKAVAAQAAAAIENTRLIEEAEAAEQLEKQVGLAAAVQQRMIPHTSPDMPGLDLAHAYVPALTLGGDFFDFIPLPDDNVGLAIADVSGKGVPASLTMASVRAFLRAQVDNVYFLNEVVKRINLLACRDIGPAGEFVTLFYGVLDARNRRLTYCNAGHPPAMLLRDGEVTELRADNMVLGVDPDEQYVQAVIDLRPGDALLLYTDGLPDGRNFADESFGRQRVVEAFAQGGETAEAIAQNVLWQLRKFVGMAKRTDDVTMIVAKVR
jgi:sigma-B regulation protein RsbU (phosphoserine phosphatase)